LSLAKEYVLTYGQLGDFFKALQKGQAPQLFTTQLLKDLGFTSSNHRAFIRLLKALGFLTSEGEPTKRYHDFRDTSRSRAVLGQALKEAYGDLFVLRSHPTESDRSVIEGKFKSTHNVSDNVAKNMTNTFYNLLALADLDSQPPVVVPPSTNAGKEKEEEKATDSPALPRLTQTSPTLHYNIQIHLPATKEVEVYNAIFKSLREHLID